ncbi:MAG: hypothetical protein Q7Q73_07500 [Verrucomicrobiota bacterium JB024]|nr:hypothetical protein [Verrucomicrobiota bacterium JB024]
MATREFQPQSSIGAMGSVTAPVGLTAGEAQAGQELGQSIQRGSDQYIARAHQANAVATRGQLVSADAYLSTLEKNIGEMSNEYASDPDKYRTAAVKRFDDETAKYMQGSFTDEARAQTQAMVANMRLAMFGNDSLEGSIDYKTQDMRLTLGNAQLWKQSSDAVAAGDADTAVALTEAMHFDDPMKKEQAVERVRASALSQRDRMGKEAHVQRMDALKLDITNTDSLGQLESLQASISDRNAQGPYAGLDDRDRSSILPEIESRRRKIEQAQATTSRELLDGFTYGIRPTHAQIDMMASSDGSNGLSQYQADILHRAIDNYDAKQPQGNIEALKKQYADASGFYDKLVDDVIYKPQMKGDQPDPIKMEDALRRISNSSMPEPLKRYHTSQLFRAMEVDLDDGVLALKGYGMFGGVAEEEIKDQEAEALRGIFRAIQTNLENYPTTSGAAAKYFDAIPKIHRMFEGDKEPTTEQLRATVGSLMREIFGDAVARTLRGESEQNPIEPVQLMFQEGVLMSAGTRN